MCLGVLSASLEGDPARLFCSLILFANGYLVGLRKTICFRGDGSLASGIASKTFVTVKDLEVEAECRDVSL